MHGPIVSTLLQSMMNSKLQDWLAKLLTLPSERSHQYDFNDGQDLYVSFSWLPFLRIRETRIQAFRFLVITGIVLISSFSWQSPTLIFVDCVRHSA